MARIAGIELVDTWRVDFALTRIKGIGWSLSKSILASLKIDPAKRLTDVSPEELAKIWQFRSVRITLCHFDFLISAHSRDHKGMAKLV